MIDSNILGLTNVISIHYKNSRVIGVMFGTWEMAEQDILFKGIVLLV